ncbi:MAG: VWA domain-containing protein [Ardenticatenales bacterium]
MIVAHPAPRSGHAFAAGGTSANPAVVRAAVPFTSELRAYLPYTVKSPACRLDATTVDVVLVLDRSTSMLRPIEPSVVTKNDAAIGAAREFVRLLDLTPDAAGRSDQIGIVGFNDTVWTELALTDDENAANAALDRLSVTTAEGTRLDLAFRGGAAVMDGPNRRAANRAVMVVLTDGLPNRVPYGPGSPYPGSARQEDAVRQAADAAKARGTRVYTIGLGGATDVNLGLLEACASDPSMFHEAPRPEDLAAIYRGIAVQRRICDPAQTATPRLPTDAPTSTATPTSPPPTATPTPTACIPTTQYTDVSLVIDMSTSMSRSTGGGTTKLDAALAAARSFIGQMRLAPDAMGRHDQVAVSGFNGESWTSVGLTNDAAAAEAALLDLATHLNRGTRLDLAFVQGQAALEAGVRGPGNLPAMIVLTDGQGNGVPADPGRTTDETVLDRAQRAKDAGTTIFTIGLGAPTDVDRALLEAAAGDPSRYFETPNGDDLAAIYRRIAGRLTGCP